MNTHYIYNKKTGETVTDPESENPGILRVDQVIFAIEFIKKYNLCLVGKASLSRNMIYFYNKKTGVYEFGKEEKLSYLIQQELPSKLINASLIKSLLIVVKNNITKEIVMNENENIINFQNGVLHLDTLKLEEHSPDYYTTIQVNCNWNPKANKGKIFDNFMEFFCNKQGNPEEYYEIRNMILKFFGVAISNVHGYRLKKGLFFVGAGNTGKTQLKGLCERIIGSQYSMNMNLKVIEGRWGLGSCYDKRIVGSNDQSFQDIKELSNFKQITGGDYVFAELKGVDGFTFKYTGIVWICSNNMPNFEGDKGKHVYERLVIYEPVNVVSEEEKDNTLLEKMLKEKEYIVVQAVRALRELIKEDFNLQEPKSIANKRKNYEIENNSALSFLKECCIERNKDMHMVSTKTFFDLYVNWCKFNNNGKYMKKKDVTKLLASIGWADITRSSEGDRYYKIFTVSEEFINEYRDFTKDIKIKTPIRKIA